VCYASAVVFRGSKAWGLAVLSAALLSCGGGSGSGSLGRRQADYRNVDNIMRTTVDRCRASVTAAENEIRHSPGGPDVANLVNHAASEAATACSDTSNEEIQDLATLSEPAALQRLHVGDIAHDLASWARDYAARAMQDLSRLLKSRSDAAAAADLGSRSAAMNRLAQDVEARWASVASALQLPPAPLNLPKVDASVP
jgi:hypothetical protein